MAHKYESGGKGERKGRVFQAEGIMGVKEPKLKMSNGSACLDSAYEIEV